YKRRRIKPRLFLIKGEKNMDDTDLNEIAATYANYAAQEKKFRDYMDTCFGSIHWHYDHYGYHEQRKEATDRLNELMQKQTQNLLDYINDLKNGKHERR